VVCGRQFPPPPPPPPPVRANKISTRQVPSHSAARLQSVPAGAGSGASAASAAADLLMANSRASNDARKHHGGRRATLGRQVRRCTRSLTCVRSAESPAATQ